MSVIVKEKRHATALLLFVSDEELIGSDIPAVGAMNTMTQPTVSVDQESIVLAGFRDCTEEAIRYLMEVEHLPEDDPLVMGLKQHLLARQQQLDVDRILHGHSGLPNTGSDSSNNSSDSGDSIVMTSGNHGHHSPESHLCAGGALVVPTNLQGPRSLSPGAHHIDSASSRSDTPMSDNASEGNRSEVSDVSSEFHVPDSAMISSSPDAQQHPAGSQQPQAQDVASVLNLALLAQSNPAIANLTEELLSLLEGEASADVNESEEEADSAFLDESIE